MTKTKMPTYKGIEIEYDCQCPIPKPTKNTNPIYQSTQCECGNWINDSEIITGFDSCLEFTEIPNSVKHGTL